VLHELAHHHAGFAVYYPLILAVLGIITAFVFYQVRRDLPGRLARALRPVHTALVHKYGFDELYQRAFAGGGRSLARLLWQRGDVQVIDGYGVNGAARSVGRAAARLRHVQSGYVYHYAFAMLIGVFVLVSLYIVQ
jgi:NADH-quinone oxidoreductase subunit L